MFVLAQYDRSKNLRPKRNIRTAMNHEVMMYAIAQKEQMGLDKAVEECSAPTPATTTTAPFADSCLRPMQSTGCRATA